MVCLTRLPPKLDIQLPLLFFLSVLGSCSAADSNFTEPLRTSGETLQCYFQISGTIQDHEYDENREVDSCEPTIKYCQKISAHYHDTDGQTNILMKGCETVSIPPYFDGIVCQKEGCFEKTADGETYNVCCCSDAMCNLVTEKSFWLLITALCLMLY